MPEEKNQDLVLEISEPIVEENITEETFNEEGLIPEEIAMAKEHGLIKDKKEKEDGEHKVDTGTETEDNPEVKEKVKEEEVENPTFDDVEKKEDLIEKYNPNEKALYWKWKSDKKKRQVAEQEREEFKAKYELDSVKNISSKNKLDKIKSALEGGGEITIETLQSIIDGQEATKDDGDRPLTKKDLEEIESAKATERERLEKRTKQVEERLTSIENIGKTKHPEFDKISDLAQEITRADKSGTYQKILTEAFVDLEMDEDEVIDRIVTLAKLSPKFKDVGKVVSPEDKEKADRVLKNSKKQINSASLTPKGNKRAVSEDDLTVDDAAQLSTDQWLKLKDSTRQRLLGKIP